MDRRSRRLKTFSDYCAWLIGTIDKAGIVADRSALCRFPQSKRHGYVFAPREGGFAKPGAEPLGLIMIDGAFLRFKEWVVVESDGSIIRLSYNYHYQRPDGFFIRYDKIERPFADSIQNVLEPQCHVHVADEDFPRCKTHEANFEEVMAMIRYNFYAG